MDPSEWQSRLATACRDHDGSGSARLLKTLATEPEPQAITTWQELLAWIEPFKDTGCFRGEKNVDWRLDSSLDRAVTAETSVELDDRQTTVREWVQGYDNERKLLLDFQRGAGHHHSPIPAPSHTVDWLALMQHYGAPTRLLDWSRSPYVALYFALEKDFAGDSTLWAIDMCWLRRRSLELLREKNADCPDGTDRLNFSEYIAKIILQSDSAVTIVLADPMQLNERMLAQQGQLLGNVGPYSEFSDVLLRMLCATPEKNQVISRAILKRDNRLAFMRTLHSMNVHRASLFPGIDGFAKSLGIDLELRIARYKEERRKEMLEGMEARRKGRL